MVIKKLLKETITRYFNIDGFKLVDNKNFIVKEDNKYFIVEFDIQEGEILLKEVKDFNKEWWNTLEETLKSNLKNINTSNLVSLFLKKNKLLTTEAIKKNISSNYNILSKLINYSLPYLEKVIKNVSKEFAYQIDKFYDYLDVRKLKFSEIEGKNLFQSLKIPFDILNKYKKQLKESKDTFATSILKGGLFKTYGYSVIEDYERLLKDKLYSEKPEQDVSQFLSKTINNDYPLFKILFINKNMMDTGTFKTLAQIFAGQEKNEISIENVMREEVKYTPSLSLASPNLIIKELGKEIIIKEESTPEDLKLINESITNFYNKNQNYILKSASELLETTIPLDKNDLKIIHFISEQAPHINIKPFIIPQQFYLSLASYYLSILEELLSTPRLRSLNEKEIDLHEFIADIMYRLQEIYSRNWVDEKDIEFLNEIGNFILPTIRRVIKDIRADYDVDLKYKTREYLTKFEKGFEAEK